MSRATTALPPYGQWVQGQVSLSTALQAIPPHAILPHTSPRSDHPGRLYLDVSVGISDLSVLKCWSAWKAVLSAVFGFACDLTRRRRTRSCERRGAGRLAWKAILSVAFGFACDLTRRRRTRGRSPRYVGAIRLPVRQYLAIGGVITRYCLTDSRPMTIYPGTVSRVTTASLSTALQAGLLLKRNLTSYKHITHRRTLILSCTLGKTTKSCFSVKKIRFGVVFWAFQRRVPID